MKNKLFGSFIAIALCAGALPSLAAEDEGCLECHEPAEDWEDMSAEEIFTDARAPGNKRHKDNDALSDDQLKAIIAPLVPE
jgi:hypothetical protein